MLIVISPAKTLDFDTASTTDKHSKPDFLSHSRQLIDVLRDRSPDEISSLMGISSKLGDLNYQRYTALCGDQVYFIPCVFTYPGWGAQEFI